MSITSFRTGKVLTGYQVRLGRAPSKLFSLAKCGGQAAALKMAEAHEQRLKAEHPEIKSSGPRLKPSRMNTSGVVGIRARLVQYAKDGQPIVEIQGSWSKDGRYCCTNLSVNKHGAIEAVRLAMSKREAATGVAFELTPRQVWYRIKRAAGITTRG